MLADKDIPEYPLIVHEREEMVFTTRVRASTKYQGRIHRAERFVSAADRAKDATRSIMREAELGAAEELYSAMRALQPS